MFLWHKEYFQQKKKTKWNNNSKNKIKAKTECEQINKNTLKLCWVFADQSRNTTKEINGMAWNN